MLEEKSQGVEVLYAKDLEKTYLEILSEHGIQYECHTSWFASLLVSNNDDLEKCNIGSKITICFTACADTIFKDMMDPGTIIRSTRDIVRPLRKLMAEKKNSFNGTFDIDCQLKLIPIQLLTLVNMLIDGPACTTVSQASLSIAQLIFSNFKQAPGHNAAAFRRDNLDHETPLKLYYCLKMISDARSKKLVENSHSLGLGASYSWARNVIKDLSKLSIYQYHINGVFVPRSLKRNVSTIIAKDNIDKNARSNTAFSHYHGISKTVMQFPKADIPGDNLAIHPINEKDDHDLTSIPSSYSIVPQVYQGKEPLHPQVLTFQGTVNGLAEVFKQALIEEYRWLETVVETHQNESIIPSWSKYHSNKERNAPSVKGYHSLLSLIDAPVHTIASQYHCMNIIMKTIEYLSPGQIAVDVCDLPVSASVYNIETQKNLDQANISV